MSFNGAVAPWGRYREFHGFQVAPQSVGKLSQEPEMRSAFKYMELARVYDSSAVNQLYLQSFQI